MIAITDNDFRSLWDNCFTLIVASDCATRVLAPHMLYEYEVQRYYNYVRVMDANTYNHELYYQIVIVPVITSDFRRIAHAASRGYIIQDQIRPIDCPAG